MQAKAMVVTSILQATNSLCQEAEGRDVREIPALSCPPGIASSIAYDCNFSALVLVPTEVGALGIERGDDRVRAGLHTRGLRHRAAVQSAPDALRVSVQRYDSAATSRRDKAA